MVNGDENLSDFCDGDDITLESLRKKFKADVIKGVSSLSILSQEGLASLKSIENNGDRSSLTLVFNNAIKSTVNVRDENCLEFSVSGFKSLTHKNLLKTLENKFSKKNKDPNYINFELIIPNMTIPYVKRKIFPSLRIRATSSISRVQFKVFGESGFIFILFYLRKVLEVFMKNLPVPLNECYESVETSGTSTDSQSTETDDSSPQANNKYKRIVQIKSIKRKGSVKIPGSSPKRRKCDAGLNKTSRNNKTPEISSVETLPESGSPIFKRRKREPVVKRYEEECAECGMYFVSMNVQAMVDSDYMELILTCTDQCTKEDQIDTMDGMIASLYDFISKTELVNKDTIHNFIQNFKRISEKVLDKTSTGRAGFYNKMWEGVKSVAIAEADKIVTVLNEIVVICMVGEVGLFEEKLMHNKEARRNMIFYLQSTRAFFSAISVIESFHQMMLKGVDILKILPAQFHFIANMFNSIKAMNSRRAHHENMSRVTRSVFKVFKRKNIEVVELKRKEFRIGQTGRSMNIPYDLFLYQNKDTKKIITFLFFGKNTCAETIDFEDARFDKEQNTITTSKWIFHLKNLIPEEILEVCGGIENKKPIVDPTPQLISKPESTETTQIESTETTDKNSMDNDDFDDVLPQAIKCVISDVGFMIEKKNIFKYWQGNQKRNQKRKFNTTRVGLDWPKMFGGVCPIVIEYNYVTKYGSRKINAKFAKLVGRCVVCNARYTFTIDENPFEEHVEEGVIKYEAVKDLIVDVEAEGQFFVSGLDEPILSKPVHLKKKVKGLQLRSRERELLGDMAAQQGVLTTHREQLAFAMEDQIEVGNITSMRSYPVIKMAKQEQEKKMRGGENFYDSAKNVLLGQDIDVSPDFPDLTAAKLLPGMVRSLQEHPFKVMLSNFEMLRIGAIYLSGEEETILYMDSSGKFWQERRRTGKDLLNTAIVLPPLAEGLSPFPIFEMISETNKTIDFLEMLQHAWNHMSSSVNNKIVPYPKYCVSDLSFPNIHSLLMAFNKIKLSEYLSVTYDCVMKRKDVPLPSTITICENHLLPAILKTSRSHTQEKVIADTVVAGFMLVLRADSIGNALKIFENLCKVHCEKGVNEEARNSIKSASLGDLKEFEMITDFGDDTPLDEIAMYGNRRALRLNSEYYHLFMRIIEKIMKANENVSVVTNRMFYPALIKFLCKQYLSLFPLLSAVFLNGGLKSNAHIELYWKSKRATMAKVPKAQHWPAKLIGIQHHQTRKQAKEIHLHSLVPNLRSGRKKSGQTVKHPKFMQEVSGRKETNEKYFMPTASKLDKKDKRYNESYDGSKERWTAKTSRSQGKKKDHYMKGKGIEYGRIESRYELAEKNIRVTGNDEKGVVLVTPRDVEWIQAVDSYISDNAVDAGLLLLDKRLNNPSQPSDETITVYSVQELRLILSGENQLVNIGKFVCIMPRNFALDDLEIQQEQQRQQQGKQTDGTSCDPGSHFTLFSNLYCPNDEINCYETFAPYRNQGNLLTKDGVRLIRLLCGLKDSDKSQVLVNCMNIPMQEESECGALAFAIALQLCFHYPVGGIHRRIQNVRNHLLFCLQSNQLSDFMTTSSSITDELLFSINV